jgi:hypothetical protein
MLLVESKAAHRFMAPSGDTARGFAFMPPGPNKARPAGKWQSNMENLGKRTIDGLEMEGIRGIQTAEEHPDSCSLKRDGPPLPSG